MINNDQLNSVMLLILDGWGVAPEWGGNAISIAKTPNFDKAWKSFPHTTLCASGECVGLPGHERGNSEVGHLNLGSGRVVKQDSSRISDSIKDGSFFNNAVLIEAINHAKKRGGNLHLMGLASNGKIHSELDHLYTLLKLCQLQNFNKVYLHLFTDGRDTDPMAALSIISHLQDKLREFGIGQIATLCGRYYGMDRDNHWERTSRLYEAMVNGRGAYAGSALAGISQSYNQGITDEFIQPIVITQDGKPVVTVKPGDSMIFFNFRSDRARQISMAFMSDKMPYFRRAEKIPHFYLVGFIPYGYEEELKLDLKAAFASVGIEGTLAKTLSEIKLLQYHSAETEKYAHVTYFFNGGVELAYPGEYRVLVPSPRVSSYDLKPEMSIDEVSINAIKAINSQKYRFSVVNFANPDMVGHTGNLKAVVKACEVVDFHIGRFIEATMKNKAILIITADHGNAEQMINPRTGEPDTEHTTNPVPIIVVSDGGTSNMGLNIRNGGVLADVSPSILELLKIPVPSAMLGKTLITRV